MRPSPQRDQAYPPVQDRGGGVSGEFRRHGFIAPAPPTGIRTTLAALPGSRRQSSQNVNGPVARPAARGSQKHDLKKRVFCQEPLRAREIKGPPAGQIGTALPIDEVITPLIEPPESTDRRTGAIRRLNGERVLVMPRR